MTTLETTQDVTLDQAVANALARIPPLWPLRHFVAVNPFVGLSGLPFAEACALLARTAGSVPLQKPAEYLEAWERGQISPAHLETAAAGRATAPELVRALRSALKVEPSPPIPTVADLLDREQPQAHWAVLVAEEISKWCAVHYDENQTTWNSPWRHLGLYAAWREAAKHDANPEALGVRGFREFVAQLPGSADEAIAQTIRVLDPQRVDVTDFLTRQLQTINGWAGFVQYLTREDNLRGRANDSLRDLLAIRLAFDAALFTAFGRDGEFRIAWRQATAQPAATAWVDTLAIWQQAYELGYQEKLATTVTTAKPAGQSARPPVQAVFCIDVRSEVLRRHLEAALPGLQTIGFAGFFGFPVAHRESPDDRAGARCPVLLVPPVESGACDADPQTGRRQTADAGAWKAFQNSATSCFSFVETLGPAFAAGLASLRARGRPACTRARPALTDTDLATRTALAAGALRNMSLTTGFARLVLICGHGSRSANNPYASSLDCGACGGHAGDVNARLAAATLNDAAVRAELQRQGIHLPADTQFIAGLHDTTTDEVTLFDADPLPPSHQADFAALRAALDRAGQATRRERAATFNLDPLNPDADTRRRATDISEVRPEWGLANNAALIAAPRWRTAGTNLQGRVFLHDYDHRQDVDDKVLTLILTAPVVVASWINLQYYASRLDPERHGSGNKVLHNVTAGLGVIEGNAGDLRVGLPWQSIHDGIRFVHEPRRLTVLVEAPRERIDAVLEQNPGVRDLFDHGWITLVAIEGARTYRRSPAGWTGI